MLSSTWAKRENANLEAKKKLSAGVKLSNGPGEFHPEEKRRPVQKKQGAPTRSTGAEKGPARKGHTGRLGGTQQYGRSFVSEARQEASGRGGRRIRSWGGAKERRRRQK